MPEQVEATGRTLEEAKRHAAEQLGLPVERCEFEVIEQANKGLFAKTNFKVRATPAAEAEAEAEAEAPKPADQQAAQEPKPTPTRLVGEVEQTAEEGKSEGPGEDEEEAVVATEKDAEAVVAMIQGLFEAAGLDVQVVGHTINDRYVNLDLSGEDTDRLIDSKNPVIDSVQYLGNAMIPRAVGRGVRLTLDTQRHREKRAEVLEKLARDIGEAVLKRQQEAVLDPLPAHERRIIHRALMGMEGIETYSEGDEPNRRVVISPKRD